MTSGLTRRKNCFKRLSPNPLTVAYVLFIKIFVFHELSITKDVPRVMRESAKMVGSIMIILGAALGFTNYLVDAFIPAKIFKLMEGMITSKIAFLLVLNAFLIVVGCMMDIIQRDSCRGAIDYTAGGQVRH
jgi:C4-dicarboxylate transporter, DctM subunit